MLAKPISLLELRKEYAESPDLCRALLGGLDFEQKGFCKLCKMKPTKDGGYIQLSVRGINKFAMLQEVVLWAQGVRLDYDAGDQCSHRCGRPRCFVEEHIIMESPKDNNGRKGCRVVWKCHHGDCEKYDLLCDHQPSCIVYVEPYCSWDEFLLNGLH